VDQKRELAGEGSFKTLHSPANQTMVPEGCKFYPLVFGAQ